MTDNNFEFSFSTSKSPGEVFAYLINPNYWWIGLYGETIEGQSTEINDVFSFHAGDGMHYSKQKLTELVPSEKIVWLVTESNLSFLKDTSEWVGTEICFTIETIDNNTKVTFTHQGLIPSIECYGSCSSAWTQYLQNLKGYFHRCL